MDCSCPSGAEFSSYPYSDLLADNFSYPGRLVCGISGISDPGRFCTRLCTPAASIVHVKSALLSVLLAGLSFFVVLRLGLLVRFRRTRKSERNWRLMILFIGIVFLITIPENHQFEPNFISSGDLYYILFILSFLAAIVFILMNSIRLAWIVRLSHREQGAAIGLGALTVGLLVCVILATVVNPDASFVSTTFSLPRPFLRFYSSSLTVATVLFLLFGLIYALTSVLSLIFHLLTTGAYGRSTD